MANDRDYPIYHLAPPEGWNNVRVVLALAIAHATAPLRVNRAKPRHGELFYDCSATHRTLMASSTTRFTGCTTGEIYCQQWRD